MQDKAQRSDGLHWIFIIVLYYPFSYLNYRKSMCDTSQEWTRVSQNYAADVIKLMAL